MRYWLSLSALRPLPGEHVRPTYRGVIRDQSCACLCTICHSTDWCGWHLGIIGWLPADLVGFIYYRTKKSILLPDAADPIVRGQNKGTGQKGSNILLFVIIKIYRLYFLAVWRRNGQKRCVWSDSVRCFFAFFLDIVF